MAHGLATRSSGGSRVRSPRTALSTAKAPATTVVRRTMPHRGVSVRPVGVRCNTAATTTSQGTNMTSPACAAAPAAGSEPGLATDPYTA